MNDNRPGGAWLDDARAGLLMARNGRGARAQAPAGHMLVPPLGGC